MRAIAVAVLALAACGEDHAKPDAQIVIQDAPPIDMQVFEDAPPPSFDFSCMGNSAPTTATAQITLSGTVQEVSFNGMAPSVDPVADATVDACAATATTCMGQDQYATATSDAQGGFSIGPIDTTMMPLDGYVQMTAQDTRTVYTYPAAPLIADQGNIPVLTFAASGLQVLQLLGCTQDDTNNGMIALAVTDCADEPISDSANLTIEIKQGGTLVSGTTVIDLGQVMQQAAGTFIICNVAENAVTEVGATYNDMALRAHNVQVVKGTTTSTILRPGY